MESEILYCCITEVADAMGISCEEFKKRFAMDASQIHTEFPRWIDTKRISNAIGKTSRAVRIRAQKEGWVFRDRKAQGGGKEWRVKGLPLDILEALLSAGGDHFKVQKEPSFQKEPPDNLTGKSNEFARVSAAKRNPGSFQNDPYTETEA